MSHPTLPSHGRRGPLTWPSLHSWLRGPVVLQQVGGIGATVRGALSVPIRRPFALAAIAGLALTGVGVTAGAAAAAPPAGSAVGSYIVTLDPSATPAPVAAQAAHLG